MAVLDLTESPYTKVWKTTLEIMQSDETLRSVVQTWIVPDGSKSPNPLQSAMPVLELDPVMGPMSWFDPSSQYGYLTIKLRTYVRSYDAADVFNLHSAIIRAFFPQDEPRRQYDIRDMLAKAGAIDTGQFEFNFPPTEPDPRFDDEGLKICVGQMRISVIHTFNP